MTEPKMPEAPVIENLDPSSRALASEKSGRQLEKMLRLTLWAAVLAVLFALLEVLSPEIYSAFEITDSLVAIVYLILLAVSLVLGLIWIYKLQQDLPKKFPNYQLRPGQALARFMIPLYNLWGIQDVVSKISHQFKKAGGLLQRPGRLLDALLVLIYAIWIGNYVLNRFYHIPLLKGEIEPIPLVSLTGAFMDVIFVYVILKMIMTIKLAFTVATTPAEEIEPKNVSPMRAHS